MQNAAHVSKKGTFWRRRYNRWHCRSSICTCLYGPLQCPAFFSQRRSCFRLPPSPLLPLIPCRCMLRQACLLQIPLLPSHLPRCSRPVPAALPGLPGWAAQTCLWTRSAPRQAPAAPCRLLSRIHPVTSLLSCTRFRPLRNMAVAMRWRGRANVEAGYRGVRRRWRCARRLEFVLAALLRRGLRRRGIGCRRLRRACAGQSRTIFGPTHISCRHSRWGHHCLLLSVLLELVAAALLGGIELRRTSCSSVQCCGSSCRSFMRPVLAL